MPFTFNSNGNNQIEIAGFNGILRLHLSDAQQGDQTRAIRIDKSVLDFSYKSLDGSFEDGLLGEFSLRLNR